MEEAFFVQNDLNTQITYCVCYDTWFCRRQLLQSTEHGCDEEDGGRGSPRNLCAFPDDWQVSSTGKAGRHPPFLSLPLLFSESKSSV